MRDASPPQLTLQCDSQGRFTDRLVSGGDTYRYDYDGAGRLDNAEVNGKHSYYGYNVDDEIIFENHKGYRVYRFGSYRYSSNDKRTIVKPVPQVALLTQSGKTTSRWVFLEPDGHAFESAGDIEGQAQELSFDILGAYGPTLTSSGDVLPIDGFHGADADPGRGVVPFGVRHVVKDVGMWMQPEPLLYLGVAVGGVSTPRTFAGVYAAANPVQWGDTTGFNPVEYDQKNGAGATKRGGSLHFNAETEHGRRLQGRIDALAANDASLDNGLTDADHSLSSGGINVDVDLDASPTRDPRRPTDINLGGVQARASRVGMSPEEAEAQLSSGEPSSFSANIVASGAPFEGGTYEMSDEQQVMVAGHEVSHIVRASRGETLLGSIEAVDQNTGGPTTMLREEARAQGIGPYATSPLSANSVLEAASFPRTDNYMGVAPAGEP